jgi:hypothetical protein
MKRLLRLPIYVLILAGLLISMTEKLIMVLQLRPMIIGIPPVME